MNIANILIVGGVLLSSSVMAHRIDCRAPLESYKQYLVIQSRLHYFGPCPCPYDIDRFGYACGLNSVYHFAPQQAPLCYPNDVTKAMLNDFLSDVCPHRKVR